MGPRLPLFPSPAVAASRALTRRLSKELLSRAGGWPRLDHWRGLLLLARRAVPPTCQGRIARGLGRVRLDKFSAHDLDIAYCKWRAEGLGR